MEIPGKFNNHRRKHGKNHGKGNNNTAEQPEQKKTKKSHEGYIFRMASPVHVAEFDKTKEYLTVYIQEKFGNDVSTALENEEQYDMDQHEPEFTPSTATDPNVQKMQNDIAMEKFKIAYTAFLKRKENYEQNMFRAYAILWSHCSEVLQNKIVTLAAFSTTIKNDPIALLKTIKQQVFPAHHVSTMTHTDNESKIDSKPASRKSAGKSSRTSYASEEAFAQLRAAVLAHISDNSDNRYDIVACSIPRSTVSRMATKFCEIADARSIKPEAVTREMVYAGDNSLLNEEDLALLQRVITSRDEANNGLRRAEVVSLIMELKQTSNRRRCENHLDYLVRENRFPFLMPPKKRQKNARQKRSGENETAFDANPPSLDDQV